MITILTPRVVPNTVVPAFVDPADSGEDDVLSYSGSDDAGTGRLEPAPSIEFTAE